MCERGGELKNVFFVCVKEGRTKECFFSRNNPSVRGAHRGKSKEGIIFKDVWVNGEIKQYRGKKRVVMRVIPIYLFHYIWVERVNI